MSAVVVGAAHPTAPERSARGATAALAAAYTGALLPIVIAVIRALAEGWIPIGDNAYFLIRSRDVLTDHHPLLGAWSSGSQSVEVFVNNLGPLQLDLLAPFTKLGPASWTAIGVGLTHVLAVVGIGWTAGRLGGRLVAAVMLAATASLTWSMGSAMLVEARQHPAMLLVFLCYLVAVWAVASGGAWALSVAVFAGSLALQTHLSYALLVPGLAVWALAGLALDGRRARRSGGWEQWQVTTRRSALVAAAVALACWIQPVVDQLWGEHNMTRLLRASGEGSGPGVGTAIRMVADVVALPPFWGRDSFRQYAPTAELPHAATTALGLTAVFAVLGLGAYHARRAGRPIGVTAVGTAAVALLAAIISAARLPVGLFGLVAGNYRWLWAVGAFCASAAVVALWPAGARAERRGLVAFGSIAVLFGLLAIPASYQSIDITQDAQHVAVSRDLVDQLRELGARDLGPVLIDRSNSPFGEPYTLAAVAELQRLGIDFRFTNPDEEYRFGDGRVPQGDERHLMTFAFGGAVADVPEGSEQVAVTTGLDSEEHDELFRVQSRITAALSAGSLAVDLDAARSRLGRELPTLERAAADRPVEPTPLFFELAAVEELGLVAASAEVEADLARFLELEGRRVGGSVAVYLAPI